MWMNDSNLGIGLCPSPLPCMSPFLCHLCFSLVGSYAPKPGGSRLIPRISLECRLSFSPWVGPKSLHSPKAPRGFAKDHPWSSKAL